MKLRTKTLLIVTAALGGLIVLLTAWSTQILLRRFAVLEVATAQRDLERVQRALDSTAARLAMSAENYARWDDTYAFVRSGDPAYLRANFAASTFTTLRLNLVVLAAPDGRVVYQQGFDLNRGAKVDAPAALVGRILASPSLLRHPDPTSGRHGILVADTGPVLVAACPVVTSQERGPSRGTLIFARHLDAAVVGEVSKMTHVSTQVVPLGGPLPPGLSPVRDALATQPTLVRPLSDARIAAYARLNDVEGRPALLLRIDEPRDVYQYGRASIDYLVWMLLFCGAVFILASVAAAERLVLGRLVGLQGEVERITRTSDLAHRVSVRGSDELAQLAAGINAMLDALAHSGQENARLLAEANDAVEAKDRFIAVVAHELRNPLTSISAGMDVLVRTASDPEMRGAVRTVARNVNLQSRLVNDLLDLSRAARGMLELHREPLSLDKVVAAAARALTRDAENARVALHVHASSGVWVNGDRDRLQQMVMNLVANAIKFTPPPGQIDVRCEGRDMGEGALAGAGAETAVPPAGPMLAPSRLSPHRPHEPRRAARIVVQDTGIGISPELLPRIFGLFERGEQSAYRGQGLGIGLALVKTIAERHEGLVYAESDGPGKGSRFIVELPIIDRPEESTRPRPDTLPPPSALSLLLVEDNDDTRMLMARSLSLIGYRVEGAKSGEEALQALRQRLPDIILCDIGLPGMDGYEFMRQARGLPGMERVLAFATTGFGLEEDVRRAREVGYAEHILKPVDMADLDERVRLLLRAR